MKAKATVSTLEAPPAGVKRRTTTASARPWSAIGLMFLLPAMVVLTGCGESGLWWMSHQRPAPFLSATFKDGIYTVRSTAHITLLTTTDEDERCVVMDGPYNSTLHRYTDILSICLHAKASEFIQDIAIITHHRDDNAIWQPDIRINDSVPGGVRIEPQIVRESGRTYTYNYIRLTGLHSTDAWIDLDLVVMDYLGRDDVPRYWFDNNQGNPIQVGFHLTDQAGNEVTIPSVSLYFEGSRYFDARCVIRPTPGPAVCPPGE